jgi:MYXO-CTERM domain-containing protein
MPRPFLRLLRLSLLVCGVLAIVAPPAAADFITVNLDQSNTLPDGVLYGTVRVEAFPKLGEVTLIYTASDAPYSSVGNNFGFHTVGFNTDLTLQPSQFTLPTGWKLDSNANLSSFGVFSWKVTTTNHVAPVETIVISGLGSNATLDHFLVPSVGGNSAFFAGHIIDFSVSQCGTTTSQWVGGSDPPPSCPPPEAPEPSTLAMGAIGLVGLAVARLVRRRRPV